MTKNDASEIITIDELCDMLQIGKNTAYRLLLNGEIQAFKIGRIWKIPKQAVISFILQKSHYDYSS